MHQHILRPGDELPFEYTLCVVVYNHGRPLTTEEIYLDKQREDTIQMITQRVNEFFDSVVLMER